MDHTRDPCPWVILNDFGGAFAMGAIGGTIWHGIKGNDASQAASRGRIHGRMLTMFSSRVPKQSRRRETDRRHHSNQASSAGVRWKLWRCVTFSQPRYLRCEERLTKVESLGRSIFHFRLCHQGYSRQGRPVERHHVSAITIPPRCVTRTEWMSAPVFSQVVR